MPAPDCVLCPSTTGTKPPIEVREWPFQFIPVEKVNYQRNEDASYCKRPVEMIDTIVLHHTEGQSTVTAEDINQMHINRVSQTGQVKDPWYMIGYTYVINSPYPKEKVPTPRVTEGRPIEIVGSHAGTGIFMPMDAVQKDLWKKGKIVCGKTGGEFNINPKLVSDGKMSANVTTIGLVVVGNYAPYDREYNPDGYPRNKPRKPTQQTLEMIAKMSCQLQKKYPRMKNIKWHNYYHATSCPGSIKDHVGAIKLLAKGYGCTFQ